MASAQGPGSILVAVGAAAPAPSATQLYEIDPESGAQTALPGFPSDTLLPLAIHFDPIDGSLLVALDAGGSSLIVRLQRTGAVFQEQAIGVVPGTCTDLLIDRFGDVVASTDGTTGGVYRLPRHGGILPSQVRAQPFVTAMGSTQRLAWSAALAMSGSNAPAMDPGIGELTLDNGQFQFGPESFVFEPSGITGLISLSSVRFLLSHDDGSFSLHTGGNGLPPVMLTSTPTLPAGGAVAMKASPQGPGFVLGGSANPTCWTFDPGAAAGGTVALTAVSSSLPGNPVDVAIAADLEAEILTFARGCGSASELRIDPAPGAGLPRIGNADFAIRMRQGQPGLAALLALGSAEGNFLTLPNGCQLQVLPEFIALHVANASGEAQQALPIPALPGLIGIVVHGQWFQPDLGGVPFVTTRVMAIRLGL